MGIKNKLYKMALSAAVFTVVSTAAFADGQAFTPLNFDDTPNMPVEAPKAAAPAAKSGNAFSNTMSKVMPSKAQPEGMLEAAPGEIPIGNDNIQNAILELDNAQVGIRNDLLNYKAKYADVDAQYKLIKNERNMLYKQVKSIEKRIKNIDRAKDRIRKNMI